MVNEAGGEKEIRATQGGKGQVQFNLDINLV